MLFLLLSAFQGFLEALFLFLLLSQVLLFITLLVEEEGLLIITMKEQKEVEGTEGEETEVSNQVRTQQQEQQIQEVEEEVEELKQLEPQEDRE